MNISYDGEMKHMDDQTFDDRWSVDHVFYSDSVEKLRHVWRVLRLMLCDAAEMRLMSQWEEPGTGEFWLHVRILAPFEMRFRVMGEIAAARKAICGE